MVCPWTDHEGSRTSLFYAVHDLSVQGRRASLHFVRFCESEGSQISLVVTCFKTWECRLHHQSCRQINSKLIALCLFHGTFLSLKALSSYEEGSMTQGEYQLAGEKILFEAYVLISNSPHFPEKWLTSHRKSKYGSGEFLLGVHHDVDTGGIRLQASVTGEPHCGVPIWTASITPLYKSLGWASQSTQNKNAVVLRALQTHAFTDRYNPKCQRMENGTFILEFLDTGCEY
jgi:hypothetical protein